VASASIHPPSFEEAENIINRAKNQPTLREATVDVWFWSRPSVRPSQELRAYCAKFTSEMPSFTVPTLDAAWQSWFAEQKNVAKARKHGLILGHRSEPPGPTQAEVIEDLDSMIDAKINGLLRATPASEHGSTKAHAGARACRSQGFRAGWALGHHVPAPWLVAVGT
jgi:hypothetical protein